MTEYVKQYKCNNNKHSEGIHTVKGIDNWIHIMPCNPSNYGKFHFKFNAVDIIPHQMRMFYKNQAILLVFGYVKEIQKNIILSHNLPYYLHHIITNFFPLFL